MQHGVDNGICRNEIHNDCNMPNKDCRERGSLGCCCKWSALRLWEHCLLPQRSFLPEPRVGMTTYAEVSKLLDDIPEEHREAARKAIHVVEEATGVM